MKKFMKVIIIIVVPLAVGGAVFGLWRWLASVQSRQAAVREQAEQVDFAELDFNTILPASEDSGGLPENVMGAVEAEVLIFEYADYQCSHCAEWNTTVNRLVADYDGRVAVVFRCFTIGFPNSTAAAAAANAAARQGYWKEYKDLLFANQAVWGYLSGEKLAAEFSRYLEKASGGAGDVDKFLADMESDEVAAKVAFDTGIALELSLRGTPTFIIDGEQISPTELRKTVEKKLGE